MSFFGIFGGKGGSGALKKHAEKATNKRAQAPERWDAIQAVLKIGGPEAVEALLPRFVFNVDPSITDQEEKEAAFQGILKVGEPAIFPVVAFMKSAESISWPLKMLDALAPPERVLAELLELLKGMDTEYSRDPQKKLQVLSALEERKAAEIVPAVLPFVEDVNETVRFTAVGALYAQETLDDSVRKSLSKALSSEESVRARVRILEGFVAREWSVAEEAPSLRAKLPAGFAIDSNGLVKRNG